MVARIGTGKKIRAKCPRCGQATCLIEPATTTHTWLVYRCYKCDLKFKLPKGWRNERKTEAAGDALSMQRTVRKVQNT